MSAGFQKGKLGVFINNNKALEPCNKLKQDMQFFIKRGAKVITLSKDVIILANGGKCQLCFETCEVNRYKVDVIKKWSSKGTSQ